ncbi:SdiA-regulated domain-containing protein [Methylobacillus arboreus]|uniref:SdiA-regulated domain-containing protein n=1 Tax=Methylobacillus arboreus TaxID=755170 RepID=UPI001E3CADEE|nr:SdiA-regulated domain-containing protein [Methylobacillus arboreus]MCB5190728.1 SdiA-regulated domain-containing protein [Methylobacillus arboreus]
MTRFLPGRRLGLLLICIAALLLLAYNFRLEAIAWHLWSTQQVKEDASLRLKDYVVEREAIEIPGVGSDLSDLSYNHETHTLFTVSNKQPLIVELALDGKVLRKIHVQGISDMEGIAHIGGNRFALLNEDTHTLVIADIRNDVHELDVRNAPSLTLAMYAHDNKGFEGIVWDKERRRLLVAKERSPKRVIAIHGFVDALPGQPVSIHIEKLQETASCGLRDLSAVTYDVASGHVLLLSDDSRMVAEYDAEGKMLDTLALWRGFQGLSKSVPQAEGLAIGPDKRIYVISEPNLFYVFKPGSSAKSSV